MTLRARTMFICLVWVIVTVIAVGPTSLATACAVVPTVSANESGLLDTQRSTDLTLGSGMESDPCDAAHQSDDLQALPSLLPFPRFAVLTDMSLDLSSQVRVTVAEVNVPSRSYVDTPESPPPNR